HRSWRSGLCRHLRRPQDVQHPGPRSGGAQTGAGRHRHCPPAETRELYQRRRLCLRNHFRARHLYAGISRDAFRQGLRARLARAKDRYRRKAVTSSSRRRFLEQTLLAGIAAVLPGPAAAAAKGMAQTVLGPLDASLLGVTLAHEHIADGPFYLDRWPKDWGGRAEFTARAIDRLKVVRAAGIGTIVDLTTYDVWRDIGFLQEVSRRSGLTMIAATGQRFFPPVTKVAM